MSTTNYSIDATTYVEVSANDNILQNKGSVSVRVHYGTTLPALDTDDYFTISAGGAIVRKDALPAGNTYVRTDLQDGEGSLYDVVVGEA